MTPEEKYELEMLELQELEALEASAQPPEREEISAADPRGLTRSAGQGMFLGGGDEITGAIVASLAKGGSLLGLNDEQRPWGEIYDETRQAEDEGFREYADDNPIASLGVEIAGGLVTDRFIPGGGVRTGGKIKRLFKALGRNVGEGAVSGMLVNDENRGQGALVGGGLGGVLGGVLTAAGKVPAMVSGRHIKRKLGDTPIHMAVEPDAAGAEGVIGNLYRRGVGGSFGGRNILREQERHITDAAEEGLDTAKDRLARTTEANTAALGTKLDDMAIDSAERRATTAERFADKVDEVNAQAAAQSEIIKNRPGLALEAESRQLRSQAGEAVMPARMDPETRLDLASGDDPQKMAAGLKGWWRANGFSSVKKNNFKWNDGELVADLKTVVREDPGMMLKFSSIPGMTNKMVKKLLKLKKGEVPDNVTGEQLMAMRNVFAMASNNTSNKFDKGAMRTVANKFDDFIRKQLGADDLADFGDDLTRYGPAQTYFDAVDKAYKDGGKFNADQWLSVLPKGQRVQGAGLLQGSAGAARSRVNAATSAAKDQLKRGGAVPEATRTLTKALKRQGRKESRREGSALKRANRAARQKSSNAPQLIKARSKLSKAKSTLQDTNERRIPRGTSFPSQMVTTGMLGAVPAAIGGAVGGPAGLAAGLAAGTQVSRVLAKKSSQKVLSGQAKWQRKLQIARKKYQGSPTQKNLKALRYAIQAATVRETQRERTN